VKDTIKGALMDRVIRSAHGLTISRSFIFDRALDIIPRLCWKPEDIGLTRVHLVRDNKFLSRKKADAFAASEGISEKDITTYFEWVKDLNGFSGVERERYLRSTYWPRREQIANSMFDAALQAYTKELLPLFSRLIGAAVDNLEYVEVNTTNPIRKYTGQPDTVLIDEINKNIILIEIKIGSKSTKYTLDQHIKYIGLNALLKTSHFFPDYQLHNILLASDPDFACNTVGLDSLEPELKNNNYVHLKYENIDLSKFKPCGFDSVNELVEARLQSLTRKSINHDNDYCRDFSLYFYDWKKLYSMLPEGDFKNNYEPLMPYLIGE
jgi:hypothetical protein